MRKKICTLAQVWRQHYSCCYNCSEHDNRNCPVLGKITPAEVAGSSWGSVCVPGACPRRHRRQWAWLRRQQASSNFRLTTSLLKRLFASSANATSEHSVSQRGHRKRYGTFALRNARLDTPILFVVQWPSSAACPISREELSYGQPCPCNLRGTSRSSPPPRCLGSLHTPSCTT